jgi:phosphate/phosphite/phosphonate ABC transporter binding protein
LSQPGDIAVTNLEVPATVGVGIALTTDPQMTRELLEQFCLALSDATGIAVTACGVSNYATLLEQLAAGDVDIVWLPPITALRATVAGDVTPIALPIRNGESFYRAALFARPDARWRRLADLDGVRAAWVDPQSAAGYLIIRAYLKEQGLDLDVAFSENSFLGSHDSVTQAVRSGRADVGATFVYLDDDGQVSRAGWGVSDEMHIIAHAGPIPNDIIAARVGLNTLLVRLVQSALVDVQNAQLRNAARLLLAAEGFCVPSPEHLQPLRNLLGALGGDATKPHSMYPAPMLPQEDS